MSNKNLLLGLLAVWLSASLWWQANVIMKCDAASNASITNTDSVAIIQSPDSLVSPIALASDSVILGSPAAGITEDGLAEGEKFETIFKPINLYFRSNEIVYIKTADNQKFLKEAIDYLAANKDKSLSITNHTDDDISSDINQPLAEKRNAALKVQLISNGFAVEQLKMNSKGAAQPIATNDTPEGKKANRRVTLVIINN